jgi:site-specific DNA-methyltransferase (adenine-specific)
VQLLKRLINLFTDPGDVVIDPCCGSGSTIVAAHHTGRTGYGFEIKKEYYKQAQAWLEREKSQMTFSFPAQLEIPT